MARRQQTLRLPDRDPLLEEDGNAAGAKQWGLLVCWRALNPANDGLCGLLCLRMQPLECWHGRGLRPLSQLTRGCGQPAEGVAEPRCGGRLVRWNRVDTTGARLMLVVERTREPRQQV